MRTHPFWRRFLDNIFVIESNITRPYVDPTSPQSFLIGPVRWFGRETFWKARVQPGVPVQMKPADSLVSWSTPSLLTRWSCGSLSSSSALTPPGGSGAKLEQHSRDDKTKWERVGWSGILNVSSHTCPEVWSHFKGTRLWKSLMSSQSENKRQRKRHTKNTDAHPRSKPSLLLQFSSLYSPFDSYLHLKYISVNLICKEHKRESTTAWFCHQLNEENVVNVIVLTISYATSQ